jgi:hypothetical protein
MMRNPEIHEQKKLQKRIRFRQVTPKIFYRECEKCGMEYKLEPMWECREKVQYHNELSEIWHHYGCRHCFPSIKDFHDYLIEQKTISSKH